MQDACISIWNDTNYEKNDVMLKITDICSTNPRDPTYCATPADIKIDRIKAQLLFHLSDGTQPPLPADNVAALKYGSEYPKKVYWFFTKCWDDGLAQPAYNSTKNWFTRPALPNNLDWMISTLSGQYLNNQKSYPAYGLPRYANGALKKDAERRAAVFNYAKSWKRGDKEPSWCPVA